MKKTFYVFLVLTSVILHSPHLTESVSPKTLKAIFNKAKQKHEAQISTKVSKKCGENEVYGYVNAYCPKICGSIKKCCPPEFEIDGCTCVDGYKRRSIKDPTCIPQDECEGGKGNLKQLMIPPKETKKDIWKQPKLENERVTTGTTIKTEEDPICMPQNEHKVSPKLIKDGILKQPKLETEMRVITDTPSTTSTTIPTSTKTTETPKHQCGKNEVYGSMRPECPNTCEFMNKACVSEESIGGCVCAEGFTRKSLEDSTCVPQNECRVSAKVLKKDIWKQPKLQNEKRVITGTSSTTSSTTSTTTESTTITTEVPKNQCGENEVYGSMKANCSNTCEFINEVCPSQEIIEGCVCREGYIRRLLEDSECIPQNECREHKEAFKDAITSVTSYKLEDEMQVTTSTPSTTSTTTTTPSTTATTTTPSTTATTTPSTTYTTTSSTTTSTTTPSTTTSTTTPSPTSITTPSTPSTTTPSTTTSTTTPSTTATTTTPSTTTSTTPNTTIATTTTTTTEAPKNRCGKNEVYGVMNAYCPETCEFKNRLCLSEVLKEGCVCVEGYTRRSLEDPTCVPKNECKATCSRPNFIWFSCYPLCDLTCQNRDRMKNCSRECGVGCLCDRGYVLDESKQVCVEKWHGCP